MFDQNRNRVVQPAKIELTLEAENYVQINNHSLLLSIGCGTGELEDYLENKYHCDVWGIDIDPERIQAANRKSRKNLHFIAGDGRTLAFKSDSVDLIYTCGSLASFFEEGVKEIARITRNGGQVVLIEATYREGVIPAPIVEKWAQNQNPDQWRLLTAESIERAFLKASFQKIYSRTATDSIWWDLLFDEQDPAGFHNEDHNLRILRHYRDHIGVSLFVFEKIGRR